jgi:Retrotransposon gag protein/Zinc knuckle
MPPRRANRRVTRGNPDGAGQPDIQALITESLAGLPDLINQAVKSALIRQAGGTGGTGGTGGADGTGGTGAAVIENPVNTGGVNNDQGIHTWNSRFQKQRPRVFSQAKTPFDANNWIEHMEKVFGVVGMPDQFKARLASSMFEEDAQNWWTAYQRIKGGEAFISTLSWADFKTAFFNKFFTVTMRDAYSREYSNLKQLPEESGTEFMNRFNRLVSILGAEAGSLEAQADKCKWAVNEGIRRTFMHQKFKDPAEVAEFITMYELDRAEYARNSEKKRARDAQHTGQSSNPSQQNSHNNPNPPKQLKVEPNKPQNQRAQKQVQPQKAPINAQPVNQQKPLPPPCDSCGKNHSGICRKASGTCYRCGEAGHMIKNCPKPDPRGHVYALTAPEAAKKQGT